MSRPQFVPSKVMDFSSKILAVINQHDCRRHGAPVGFPCFVLSTDSLLVHGAICNVRATKMFNGIPTKKFVKKEQ